ncbi:MAG: metal ABC transporter substrate-binding protein [Candidatus Edwardsbacteria bacterium]
MKNKLSLALMMGYLLPGLVLATDKLEVVTATSDLADFVKAVGGDKVKVVSLSNGSQDPHFIEPRPSMVMQVKKADVLVRIGMDLDLWVQSLIEASRNSKVMYGGPGYLDASRKIEKLEVPTGKIDASMGDIHLYGNPHYWLDPENAKPILGSIVKKLCEMLPSESEYFNKNYEEYLRILDSAIAKWEEEMKPYAGAKIVTYHNSWPYFTKRFRLEIIGCVEPKPGIPPTPSHIVSLVKKIKEEKVKVIIMEPYFNLKVTEKIAKDSGAKVVVLPPSVGGIQGANTYLHLFEYNIGKLAESLQD